MRFLVELFRTIAFCLEFVIVLIFIALVSWHPVSVDKLDDIITQNADAVKYIAPVPSLILVWAMSVVRKILFPEKDKKTILQGWPEYWKLRVVTWVGLFYGLLFACAGLFAWIVNVPIFHGLRGILLVGSLVGSVVMGASCYVAEIRINELFVDAAK